ncbi:3-oxoacyl-[acyl-carrier-protein] synthase II [Saprolegnia diclina VS20]|uniref:3-oxoacyl-[acyl-carrier-protein] synthase n=1 Tax=Saprolegnia diclina (strain VS20) TaxID=1156394 RepID=T0QBG3_SAPDV|nr:3-oxoacyl-[acyl-carrier-protein] synthase II [Saprolegnia diclina VS20]EQC35249.1 3-oxoacyl-[acyl-carrier-protein] synthase II [Saprolegnia diclina VS20]|eukprot:XP_008611533.1 3-oxoacyl-[acyl-carrier-protein] synthase II [Saprolegnia diclina VS20]
MFPPPPAALSRRVVITGLGAVTPLGVGLEATWNRLINGDCGISTLTSFDTTGLDCTVGGQVPDFDPLEHINRREARSQDVRFISFAIAAANEAIKDAQWTPASDAAKERAGVAIGAGIGNLQEIVETAALVQQQKYRRVSPFFVPRILINLAAGHVSMMHGLKGPNHACTTACATGSHSIGDAYRFIRNGDADVMVAGGSEASLNPLSMCGFLRAKALATKFNDNPEAASRPFDAQRDGFVMGEGAGVCFLEEYEHAKARGARIYGEIRGYGLSGDAHHLTAPTENGDGAFRAMQSAVAQSGLQFSDIGYINAHATSTPLGDAAENRAIKRLFGSHAYNLSVSSTKGAVGHLLGAAGAIEAIFALKAMHESVLPPTLNLHEKIDEFDLDYVPLEAKARTVNAVLSNSFGFGGTNSSLCFAKI